MTTYEDQDKGVKIMVACPECAAELALDPDVEEGEIVVCPDCGASDPDVMLLT